MKGGAPPLDEILEQMAKRARGMDPGKIRGEDVARSGGGAPAEAE
jgi:ParB family chromosome partitioning protein